MRLHRIGLLLMLTLGAASAYSDPGNGRNAREAVRAYQIQIQSVTLERSMPQDQFQSVPQERRKQGGMPESSGYGSAGDAQSNSQQAENTRRQGRMTPEERRALRRQIDEAGHDIYSPKR